MTASEVSTRGRPPTQDRADVPVPVGFRIELDRTAREVRPGVWLGGQPTRVLRLTGAGATAWAELREGPVRTRQGGLLARRLIDAGLAHPVPPPAPARPDVTVVIPVRDRPAELRRCLAALGPRYQVIVVDDGSADELAVRAAAAEHGAAVVRLDVNLGPAAARNAGLCAVTSELVAFVDSDTVPDANIVDELAAHLSDPMVAAVAPRMVALERASRTGRYARVRGSLDLGPDRAAVRPYARVSYVPTAALLARRCAIADVAEGAHVFDPAMRVGEDVDLVWRLLAAGWLVRYEPGVRVEHEEPATLGARLRRRFRYGTSAASIAGKHPRSMAPLVIHPWSVAAIAAVLSRRPVIAAGTLAGATVVTGRTLRRAGVPARHAPGLTAAAVGRSWLGIARYATQFCAPALVLAAVRGNRTVRVVAPALLVTPALTDWTARHRGLDPVRYTAARLLDDMAYGAGVLAGCAVQRTTVPLQPVSSTRSR